MAEPLWELEDPDSLFDLLLCQMATDIAGPRWDAEYLEKGPDFIHGELAEIQRQAMEYLSQMPDESARKHYTAYIGRFIEKETAKAERYLKSELRR